MSYLEKPSKEIDAEIAAALGIHGMFSPSTDWAQGGPLMERFTILPDRGPDAFYAYTNKYWWAESDGGTEYRVEFESEGGDMLAAAMRCLHAALTN